MVQRVCVENREGGHTAALSVEYGVAVRMLNRYDVEGTTDAEFVTAVYLVFAEPQVDNTYATFEEAGLDGEAFLSVEPLPGQFDQCADSAAQCTSSSSKKSTPPYVAKGGAISAIVPFVSHIDHTEHDTMIIITEYGVADLRGLAPKERVEKVISVAHPDYRPLLEEYYAHAKQNKFQHTPHDLKTAFDFQINFAEKGDMRG